MCVIEVTKEKQIVLVFEHACMYIPYKKEHTHNIESFIRFTSPIIMLWLSTRYRFSCKICECFIVLLVCYRFVQCYLYSKLYCTFTLCRYFLDEFISHQFIASIITENQKCFLKLFPKELLTTNSFHNRFQKSIIKFFFLLSSKAVK